MKFENIDKLDSEKFRRLTGVKKKTFNEMSIILKEAEEIKMKEGGRPHKLTIEDRLLMTLEYLREYRTYFHIATNYNLSESNAFRAIKWIENTLIKSGKFSLPGRKALLESDVEYELILIDATESPIERPKKNKRNTTRARKNDIRSKPKS
jgi:hypothetical protein